MIKNIFLDLDETILDFHSAEHNALKKTFDTLGIPSTQDILNRYSQINEQQWRQLEQGMITKDKLKIRRFQLLFDEIDSNASPAEATEIYSEYLSQGHYFIDGAEEMLKKLSQQYRLFLVSNGSSNVQWGRLKSSGIIKYFEEIFISDDIGYNKPRKEFFDYCFKKIPDFKKEESIIVGDSLTSDIQGGINAGIRTVWFQRNTEIDCVTHTIHPDYTIHQLMELIPLISLY